MAFDLVQYFSEQIKLQKLQLFSQYSPKEKQFYIHEVNVLTLGQLISIWRQDPKKLYHEIKVADPLYIQEIARHLTTSKHNKSALSVQPSLESSISEVLSLQFTELNQLDQTGSFGQTGLTELLGLDKSSTCLDRQKTGWSTNQLTELKGSKPVEQQDISLEGISTCGRSIPLPSARCGGADQAREYGLLGDHILGTDFPASIWKCVPGAGAFVCGEETALMQSIEGLRVCRAPVRRFATSGLWGQADQHQQRVETYANVPQIILRGGDWFGSLMGTEKSVTKTFAIAGKVKRTGLIEVPLLGVTIREIVYDVGGGILNDKKFKAVQTGGPMGGCIPEKYLDLPVDYDNPGWAAIIMGSGGFGDG